MSACDFFFRLPQRHLSVNFFFALFSILLLHSAGKVGGISRRIGGGGVGEKMKNFVYKHKHIKMQRV